MHISKLALVNYRNFVSATLRFSRGVNTLIGENGAGKTNVLRAIRLMLDETMVRTAYRLDESDFHRGLGSWRGHWIIISVEFEDISADEAMQAHRKHRSLLPYRRNRRKDPTTTPSISSDPWGWMTA